MFAPIENEMKSVLQSKHRQLEEVLGGDVITYYGPIMSGAENLLVKLLEDLEENEKGNKVYIVLTTTGGMAETVERMVNVLRFHYKEVNFVVPDYAYSAGTIFCMSGDNILMDYLSVLGPIDPQVKSKDGKMVAALGYLDKVNGLIKKAENNKLTDAEFVILKDFDLAELRAYEQARDLTIDLLEKWLVIYKFKNWNKHSKTNETVTPEQKIERAKEIGTALSDSNKWKSHGRPIGIKELAELKLIIDDYSNKILLRKAIRQYHSIMMDYINMHKFANFVQSRRFV